MNIRKQIKDISGVVNSSTIKKFLKKDSIYQLYKEKSKEKSLSLWRRVSMSLCSAFFYNTARRMHNSNEDYLLISEGNVVSMDPNSAFGIKGILPEYLIYTELSGKSVARGIMRSMSEVKKEWVQPYLKKVKEMNKTRVGEPQPKADEKMIKKRMKQKEEEEVRVSGKDEKVRKALERFKNRKKLRNSLKN